MLAALVLSRNAPVSADALIDLLWNDDVPERAANAIQVYVSQLRKTLGRDRIVTTPAGYELRVGDGECDVERFEVDVRAAYVAAERGQPANAIHLLRGALALWRGSALQDVADQPYFHADAARLDEARLVAIEDKIAAELAVGAHDSVVGELEALVSLHPLRERLWGQLMLALYRSGRQAEALRAYQRLRSTLAEELGIDPSVRVAALDQAILEQHRSLDWQPPATSRDDPAGLALPAALDVRGPLVDRGDVLSLAARAWDAARQGSLQLVLLTGEPGIGKSRLASELARSAAVDGAVVLLGRCDSDLRAPYRPWVEALTELVRVTPAEELRALGDSVAELARLVPGLESRLPIASRAIERGAVAGRALLFDAVVRLLTVGCHERPLVIVIEDLQWADPDSMSLLRHVAATEARCSVLLIGTAREPEASEPPLVDLVAALRRRENASISTLGPLDRADLPALLRSGGYEGLADNVTALRMIEQAEGNPLFALEMARHLTDTDWEGPLPAGVTEVIGERLRRLDERALTMLSAAATIGREFGVLVLSRVDGVAVRELLDHLDAAAAARLITESDRISGEYRFTHDLVRRTLYEKVPPARRAALHQRIGVAIEHVHAAELDAHTDELAHHFTAAGWAGDRGRAVTYVARSAALAAERLALDEAAARYRQAIELLGPAVDDFRQRDFLLALGDVERRAGDLVASRSAFFEAADWARKVGDVDGIARAALGVSAAFEDRLGGMDRAPVDLVQEALDTLGEEDSATRARLLSRLAWEITLGNPTGLNPGDFIEEREVASLEAMEMARRVGDEPALIDALVVRRTVIGGSPDIAARLALAEEAAARAERVGDTDRRMMAAGLRISDLFAAGRVVEMEGAVAEFERLAAERQPGGLWVPAAWRASRALSDGRLAEAEAATLDVLAQAGNAQQQMVQGFVLGQMFLLRWLQGRLPELEAIASSSGPEFALPMWQAALAILLTECGRQDEARTIFDDLLAHDCNDWLVNEGFVTRLCLLALLVEPLDRSAKASVLHERLRPYAGQNVLVGSLSGSALGATDRYLGLLSAAAGWEDEAEAWFERALTFHSEMGAQTWVAYSSYDLGRLLIARGGDERRGSALLRDAEDLARRCGLVLASADLQRPPADCN